MKYVTLAAVLAAAACLTACNKGLDHKLDTGHGADSYKASLEEATKDMKKAEIEKFDEYVSKISIAKLHELHPNATPREIIRGRAKSLLEDIPKVKAELEKMIPAYDKEADEIEKGIYADGATFAVEKDFFGDQPKVRAKIINTSGHTMTSLSWKVELFLNGSDKPVASTFIQDNYKNGGGIKSGYEYKRDFTIGFVRGDANFTTLEIQNAAKREVKLTLNLADCISMNGESMSSRNPHAAIAVFEKVEKQAQADKDF